MDAAYVDKPDGKIPEDFWERKIYEWRAEEHQVKMAIDGLVSAETSDRTLDEQSVFELANKAFTVHFAGFHQKAKLLRMLCSNFSVDAVSVSPTYRYPFDLTYKKARLDKWSDD